MSANRRCPNSRGEKLLFFISVQTTRNREIISNLRQHRPEGSTCQARVDAHLLHLLAMPRRRGSGNRLFTGGSRYSVGKRVNVPEGQFPLHHSTPPFINPFNYLSAHSLLHHITISTQEPGNALVALLWLYLHGSFPRSPSWREQDGDPMEGKIDLREEQEPELSVGLRLEFKTKSELKPNTGPRSRSTLT
ncbi:hypothetical protein EVAR_81510_1 [Eumeta japonica]|uniref:Uncharacterized protein n=1 Tax=Eumeta variegata TaxID=151549 RepID=A0A4C1W2H0_EUMVA|nr:hypothetical protein EVAR_81510_1 [Eumeta japonica]